MKIKKAKKFCPECGDFLGETWWTNTDLVECKSCKWKGKYTDCKQIELSME